MNTLFCGVLAVAGCVVLAGVSVAETSKVREQEKNEGTEETLQAQPFSEPSKLGKWPMERHANPNVGKEETKELLRGKRPK
ncbi:hypothetical protein GCM10011487_38690 [Steroidobacter agaridevorans]|uniref:Uncharacterized protein n=1 Tax=Steroidobacter agaridevorans TaxID=2695856 RepID=A0A829YF07_9GAMM|nr:hypothetical protein [Steroidobacter agaridevorans]GFE81869.1 hypothetical protein GCM10011487_38690 [Steroidobacter agaridevorans]